MSYRGKVPDKGAAADMLMRRTIRRISEGARTYFLTVSAMPSIWCEGFADAHETGIIPAGCRFMNERALYGHARLRDRPRFRALLR